MRPGKQSRYIQMWPRCRDCEHGACGVWSPFPPSPLLVLVCPCTCIVRRMVAAR